jgi:hypothetical protein
MNTADINKPRFKQSKEGNMPLKIEKTIDPVAVK